MDRFELWDLLRLTPEQVLKEIDFNVMRWVGCFRFGVGVIAQGVIWVK